MIDKCCLSRWNQNVVVLNVSINHIQKYHQETDHHWMEWNEMETGKRNIIKTATYDVLMKKRFIYLLLCKYQPQHVNQQ